MTKGVLCFLPLFCIIIVIILSVANFLVSAGYCQTILHVHVYGMAFLVMTCLLCHIYGDGVPL